MSKKEGVLESRRKKEGRERENGDEENKRERGLARKKG